MTYVIGRPTNDVRMNHFWQVSEWDVRVALHEAGHAIAALALGFRLECVTAESGEGFAGRCIRSLDTRQATDEERAYLAVAGAAGETFGVFSAKDFLTDVRFSSDRDHLYDAVPDVTPAQVQVYISNARYMLDPYRAALDSLADALLSRKTLDEAGIEKVLRRVHYGDILLRHWRTFETPARPAPVSTPTRATSPASQPRQAARGEQDVIRGLEKIIDHLERGKGLPPKLCAMIDNLAALDRSLRKAPSKPAEYHAPSYRVGNTRVETRDLVPGLRYSDAAPMEVR